ncbi:MAG TPA: ABC transporter substrate-binding protein [Methanospirillum sp.]|uniref:ABC transporter substrate-binding protein n=1 Tax=Methanospirillum sp. TaxID=45200 RepID=UPI002CCBAF38|nr:ABC transporter substrate-binding protein [Methanospirillum sp.]HWQ62997.1 ABC transporter substrate-binding protein [Methanospirillum sp.]
MTLHRIRIGHLSTVYHTAFILMGTDLLEKNQIQAEWTLFPSGPDIIRAMEKGDLDLAYLGLPPFIIGLDRGLQARCVAGGHIEGTVIIAGPAVLPLDSYSDMNDFLDQFAGKSIGTPPKGSIHDIIVRDLLSRYGKETVHVKNYAWADFLHDALEDGEIAAAAGTPALAVAARRYGSAQIVVPAEKIWPFNPSYGIIATDDLIRRGDIVPAFIQAHEDACQMIRKNPGECAKIVADTCGFVDEIFVEEAYRISPHYCAALPPEYVKSTKDFSHTLHTLGSTVNRISEDDIFDLTIVNEIHPAGHHYRD